MTELVHLELAKLKESPFNPRQHFDADALADLQDSIASQGILQPLVVRLLPPGADMFATHEIVCGHRRARAATELDMETVPCIVRHMSDLDAAIAQAHENAARADITPLEEASMFSRLHTEHGLTVDEVAEKVSKSRSYVYGRMKLSGACEAVQDAMRKQGLPAELALELARIPAQSLQEKALASLRDRDDWVSVRVARRLVRGKYFVPLGTSAWHPGDATLTSAGDCHSCPSMSMNDPDTHTAFNGPHCLNPDCFTAKTEAHFERERQARDAARKAAGRDVNDADDDDDDEWDSDATTYPEHPATPGQNASADRYKPVSEWSPAEQVTADHQAWRAVKRRAVAATMAKERTADDVRLVLEMHLLTVGDFGEAGHLLGIHSAELDAADGEKARAWLQDADGKQMADLLVGLAVADILGSPLMYWAGQDRAQAMLAEAKRFGIDVAAELADAAQATPADSTALMEAA